MSAPTAPDYKLSHTFPPAASASLVWPPLLVALVALAGSLWLSMGMGFKACPLCFYQRTLIMGVIAVLGIGVFAGQRHWGVLNLLALPLAVAGFLVVIFHEYLESTGKLECPPGIMGIGTSPQQSLVVLTVLVVLVAAGVVRSGTVGDFHPLAAVAAVVLGLLFAWSAVVSAPPMPPAPTKAYETPIDICRPPYRAP